MIIRTTTVSLPPVQKARLLCRPPELKKIEVIDFSCNLQSDTLQLVSRILQLASNVFTFEKAYSSTCLLCRFESSENIFHLKETQSPKMKILKRQRLSSMEKRKVFILKEKPKVER